MAEIETRKKDLKWQELLVNSVPYLCIDFEKATYITKQIYQSNNGKKINNGLFLFLIGIINRNQCPTLQNTTQGRCKQNSMYVLIRQTFEKYITLLKT